MEFHLVVVFPGLEYIEVSLQYGRVLRCEDVSVWEAVISKESDVCTWGDTYLVIPCEEIPGYSGWPLVTEPSCPFPR